MRSKFLLLLIFLYSCENLLYDSYQIIDLKRNKNEQRFYTVVKGDNLFSISRKFNISIQKLILKNNISSPYKIFPKQKILIPQKKIHIVRKGDTLYSISRLYKTDVYTISSINKINNINQIEINERIVIPVTQRESEFAKINKIKKKHKQKKILSKKKPKSLNNQNFIWPVKGKIVLGFGRANPGFYNDGINIKSKFGSSVKASQDGEIIYSGNEIPGYGNLILIKHSRNWITAYAHLEEIHKKKGSFVKKGDSIGRVGESGNVNEPQLHFEIRKGKDAVDPLKYLS